MASSGRGQWGSRMGFVLAAAGSAVGLGNIWRFPYLAGENGGSIFILVYLGCILAIGLPILIAEVMLGKTAQRDPVGTFRQLAGPRSPWQAVGFMGVLAAFMILSFYSVVAGWCVDFIYKSATGVFQPGHTMDEVIGLFKDLRESPGLQALFHGLFMVLTIGIVAAGVQKGLERWNEILMPALLLILLGLGAYSLTQPNAMAGLAFMFEPDLDQFSWNSVLTALGQCFFSLSLGMGAMMTYGSYLRENQRVPSSAGWVVITDTAIALLAGLVIFPIVFSFGQSPAQGPSLVFVTLPAAFLQMPGGTWVALAFFILLLCAALTSALSLLEVITAYFVDEFKLSRVKAAILFGAICFLIGLGCIYWGELFTFLDRATSNYLLPLGGLLISLYAGWKLDRAITEREFAAAGMTRWFGVWRWSARLVAPALVALVFLHALGALG